MISSDGSAEEYTGGSVSYYTVHIANPTTEGVLPYDAECNDIIEALGMSYAEGNAFKALWRRAAAQNLGIAKRGYKDGLYDAEKVVFFGQRLVASHAGYVDPHDTFGKPLPLEPAATTMEISHPSFGAMTYVDGQQVHCEPAADIDDESDRASAIGQNGNDGLHYGADRPSWDDAPFYAVAYIDWTGSVSQRPGFYADGGDRFLRIVDRLITDHYVVKDDIESLGYPVYYRPSKDTTQ